MPRPSRALGRVLIGLLLVTSLAADVGTAHGGRLDVPVETPQDAAPDAVWEQLTGLTGSNVLLGSAPAWRPVTDNRHDARIVFECPESTTSTTYDNGDRTQGDFTVPGCPLRIVDVPNPLGSPWIDVHPEDPDQVAFFSLHGGTIATGPTERSRTGDTHTTFTTADGGAAWADQPLSSQNKPDPGRSTGEFATGAFDRAGNLHVGYSWHLISREMDALESVVWLAKAAPLGESSGVVGRESNVKESYIYPVEVRVGGLTDEVHMVRVDPAPDGSSRIDEPNMTYEVLASDRPRSPMRGEYSAPASPSEERIVAVWPVRNNTTAAEQDAMSDYIDIAWSLSVGNDTWAHLVPEERIGPCTGTGRPAQYYGQLYIPCIVGEGYDARTRAKVGDIDIWRFDPYTGLTEYVSHTKLDKGRPILTATPDGYMALVSSLFEEEPEVYITYGWYGGGWLPPGGNIGKFFHRTSGDGIPHDARVTAAVLAENEHTLFLIYHERQEAQVPEANAFDPNHPPRPREYTKTVFSLNECDGVLAASEIPLGDGLMSFHWDAYRRSPGTFNDIQDGLVPYRDNESGAEWVYFAVNDYGTVQYGRILADEASTLCPLQQPPLLGIGTGFPQALELGSAAGNMVGAGVGVVAASMIAYLLTVKRRTAQYTTADDE